MKRGSRKRPGRWKFAGVGLALGPDRDLSFGGPAPRSAASCNPADPADGAKSRAHFAGFTLLEVLVAMALFFMAVTFFSMTYLNTLMAIEGTQLNQGLEQDLAAIRRQVLLIADVEELEEGGDVVTGEHGLARWSVQYEPTQVADLFHVTLSVELDPEDREKGVTEATEQFYLTRPSWSEPTERDELRAVTKETLLDRQLNIRQ